MDKFITDNYDVIRYCIKEGIYTSDYNTPHKEIWNDWIINDILTDGRKDKLLIDIYHTKATPKDYKSSIENNRPSPFENGYLFNIQRLVRISDIITTRRRLLINKIRGYDE